MYRRLAAFALLIAMAAPAGAQSNRPALPPAPRGVDYVETVCTGGISGGYEQTRLLANGTVQRVTRREPMASATVPRADIAAVMRDLDRARFESRSVPAMPPRIMDGVDCMLARRRNGRVHSVKLQQEAAGLSRTQDLFRVRNRIAEIARRVLSPQLRAVAQP